MDNTVTIRKLDDPVFEVIFLTHFVSGFGMVGHFVLAI
jgi:hypothetical protein